LLTAVADNRWVIWARRVIVFAAVALAAFLALAAGSAATENAWILFTASPDRGTQAPQLFRIHVSGTGLGQITSGRRPANDPAFAPDGTQLAFARLGSGLFVVNVDGSALRRLTGNGYDRYPVWSPNGRLIAFVRGARSGYHLWVMSANGKRQHRLRQAPSTAGRAAWTPDGESLIIASGGAFYEVSATTGKVRRPPHRERVLLHLCGRCRGLRVRLPIYLAVVAAVPGRWTHRRRRRTAIAASPLLLTAIIGLAFAAAGPGSFRDGAREARDPEGPQTLGTRLNKPKQRPTDR
jgi:WD40-like Beta Propeller Repeat